MRHIDETSMELILGLTGSPSQLIYSERLIVQYGTGMIEASDFWIKLDDSSHLCLSLEWHECEETLLDYSVIRAKKTDFHLSTCNSIFSFGNKSQISSVELFSLPHSEDSSLFYSWGILLYREDGKKILIHPGDSAFRNIILIHSNEEIASILSDAVLANES